MFACKLYFFPLYRAKQVDTGYGKVRILQTSNSVLVFHFNILLDRHKHCNDARFNSAR